MSFIEIIREVIKFVLPFFFKKKFTESDYEKIKLYSLRRNNSQAKRYREAENRSTPLLNEFSEEEICYIWDEKKIDSLRIFELLYDATDITTGIFATMQWSKEKKGYKKKNNWVRFAFLCLIYTIILMVIVCSVVFIHGCITLSYPQKYPNIGAYLFYLLIALSTFLAFYMVVKADNATMACKGIERDEELKSIFLTHENSSKEIVKIIGFYLGSLVAIICLLIAAIYWMSSLGPIIK